MREVQVLKRKQMHEVRILADLIRINTSQKLLDHEVMFQVFATE